MRYGNRLTRQKLRCRSDSLLDAGEFLKRASNKKLIDIVIILTKIIMSSLRNHIPRLGAVTKISKEYVSPWDAMKDEEYACPDCNNDVIFCKGEIIKPYFRHKNDGSSKCSRYDSPSESQIHKDVKVMLQKQLEMRVPIVCHRSCIRCNEQDKYVIDLDESSKIVAEHPFGFNNEKKVADIACVNSSDNTIDVIFEIMNTHKTEPSARPEPWFEIDANGFLEQMNSFVGNDRKLKCIRKLICNNCIDKEDAIIHRKCAVMDKQSLQEIVRDPAFENYVRYNLGQRKFNPQSWEEERVETGGRVYYIEARAKHLWFDYDSQNNKVCDNENERLLSPFQKFMGEKKVLIRSHKGNISYKIISVWDTKEYKVPYLYSDPDWEEWNHNYPGDVGTIELIIQILKEFDPTMIKISQRAYNIRARNIYYKIPWDKNNEFKKIGGRWDGLVKHSYVKGISFADKETWEKYKVKIDFIVSPCDHCNDTGRMYYGEGGDGQCLFC